MKEDVPFGAEFLEDLTPAEDELGATSVCTGYVTFVGTKAVDSGSDGCSSD